RIKIGFMYPDSGSMEVEARSFIAGFNLFFDKNGPFPVNVFKKPYQLNSDEMGESLKDWIKDDKFRLIVLFADVENSEKAVKMCASAKSILFIANRCVKLVSGEVCEPNVFRVSANNYVLSEPLAPWAVQNMGTTVFITGLDDLDGNEQGDFFAFGFERAGGGFADRVMSDGSPASIGSVLNAIANSDADFVFACFRDEIAGKFLKAFNAGSSKMKKGIVGPETLTSFELKKDFGSETIVNIPTVTNVINPIEIASKIGRFDGATPLSISRVAEGYDLGQIVGRMAKENFLKFEDFDSCLKFISESKFDGFRGSFAFDKNHNAVIDSWVTKWETKSGELSQKVLVSLGPSASLDFGCGRVGYPSRQEPGPSDDEGIWDEGQH
ncbi:MAG: ABC transporter substrate-binding protein, partial [Desulfomonilaceae bacterium]